MKNTTKYIAVLLAFSILFSSCATILGGEISECQKTKPKPGEPARKIRVWVVVAEVVIMCPFCVYIDFKTGAIYKPCELPVKNENK